MPAAENVKRQVTILVVIAVEEAAFLVSVQRIIRRIKIEAVEEAAFLVSVQRIIRRIMICVGGRRYASTKRSTNSVSIAAGSWLTL